jgi:hypothetical protein
LIRQFSINLSGNRGRTYFHPAGNVIAGSVSDPNGGEFELRNYDLDRARTDSRSVVAQRPSRLQTIGDRGREFSLIGFVIEF